MPTTQEIDTLSGQLIIHELALCELERRAGLRGQRPADHSRCLPLSKLDHYRRCDKPIDNNQPFHLKHDDCRDPLDPDLADPWT